MKIKNVLLVLKKHALEKVNENSIQSDLSKEDYQEIVNSYEIHNDSVKKVKGCLEDNGIYVEIYGDTKSNKKYDLIISIGGDGTFISASHLIDDETPILGINSDVDRSRGQFCSIDADDFEKYCDEILNYGFKTKKITRLNIEFENNNVKTLPVVNEILIATKDNISTTRYDITVNNETARHLDSGLLISTGAGSTAWIYTASRILEQEVKNILSEIDYKLEDPQIKQLTKKINDSHIFDSEKKEMRYFSRAIIDSKIASIKLASGFAKEMHVKSLMFDGMIVVDAKQTYDFSYGKKVKITIADNPLIVITNILVN